ncbi:ABC transporter C family member 3-like isoform X2 [Gossypium australe]|uniref:ABC-type xenobiotic transporter n=1 Tax=Gossypium australe TaxID=47621 RepID=A0A5B6X0Q3_9ROSI|nr:ABC transporter C family member 3-like isoform X2 [Gossypium australe]
MKFLSKIIGLRNVEEGSLKRFIYTNAISSFFFSTAPLVVSVSTFGACILLGVPLESGKILSALATFRILQGSIHAFPETISMVAQTKVSLDRIASFLQLDELQPDLIEKLPRGSSDTAVEIVDGNFSWDFSSTATLRNINLKVYHGMKVAVCGTVGSGKSSLLSCILGELPKISGTLKLCGTKAYVAQSPWIQSGKIEENILFGKDMDRERYDRILEACALKKDLEILPFGDQTVIGERGINLSGGQKQRVQIARALYQDADIYLLDDPFSAVDAHTGSHLFKVMEDGRITQAGKYYDILNSGTDFLVLVGAHKKALSAIGAVETGTDSEQSRSEGVEGDDGLKSAQGNESDKVEDVGPKGQLVQEEEREKGKVGFSIYWKYITTAYGGSLVPLMLLAQILFQTFQIGSNYWMAWASPTSADVEPPVGSFTLIIVYLVLAISSAFSVLTRAMLLSTVGYKTAALLFKKMHSCIFRAPMAFFDSTPSGRILNRGAWQIFIIFIPVIVTCIWYQQYYISSARELARLVGVSKAPVIQHFAETLLGVTTIRSFDQESRFQETNLTLNDSYSRPKFHVLCKGMAVLPPGHVVFYYFCFWSAHFDLRTKGTIAGLAVTYGLNLNLLQTRLVWNICNMENQIVSVERMLQYSSIPSESALVIETNCPERSWPLHGEVNILNLQVQYAPHLPLVLRGLTCTFPGGLKTGIVGKTGSGKSTLIQSLFRIIEPAAGQIIIDGVNISSIGLHDLRSRLSIIPQDPTMFGGTNGDNWSMGQRQLVCLGRVLLKKSKIVVLDEATTSVDTVTDNLIQTTLREHFSNTTVITIAHRITSVLDSDMVLLLSQGVIEEFDSPARLLENKSSSFAQLVAEYSMRSDSSLQKLE